MIFNKVHKKEKIKKKGFKFKKYMKKSFHKRLLNLILI